MVSMTENIEGLIPLPTHQHDWVKNTPYEFQDLAVVIEYLAGDSRTKVKDSGVTVTGIMPTAYGYILRTTDQHGEEIDMYLASTPDSSAPIFVIDQVNPGNKQFDEHKVMLGFSTIDEVVHTYLDVFSDGSGSARLGAITTFNPESFITWVTFAGSSLQPASRYEAEGVETQTINPIQNTPRQKQPTIVPIDEAGGVVVSLPDLSDGPKLHTTSSEPGSFGYHLNLYSALDMNVWSNTVDTFVRTLSLATPKDTVHIRIVSPGGSVILMGRIVSAIHSTKAKVITYAEGEVASAATAIWSAGHERHILPGAYFMQHMSSQLLQGKTTEISAKSSFCLSYISQQLQYLESIGLFTAEEIAEMIELSADVYVSGRTAIERVGAVSYKGVVA
jgi:ATP-dependent protease ClpP protease subunit